MGQEQTGIRLFKYLNCIPMPFISFLYSPLLPSFCGDGDGSRGGGGSGGTLMVGNHAST